MPELPEVETVMRGLRPHLEGVRIDNVRLMRKNLRDPFPKKFAAGLKGARILRLRRRAKYILMDTDRDSVLLVHLGMSGSFHTLDTGAPLWPHDHVVFTLDGGKRLAYNDPRRFGQMDLFARADEDTHKALSTLGPEPLSNDFNAPLLAGRLKGRKGPIKTALLDQKLVAGIGNIYACEALWMAGIDPRKAAGAVSAPEADLLSRAIREVLDAAIRSGGSTIRNHKNLDGSEGYFQHNFAVYGRENEGCSRCGDSKKATILAITQGGRTSFFCPVCQR